MRILPGYFGGENCISNEYQPTNLLTCSTDMGLLRLCKISEMSQLGWECPGVSYWVWQNFKKEKRKKKGESEGGEGERETEREGGRETDSYRQTERKGGRGGKQNKNNKKKIKTLICCNLLSKSWCLIFSPIPGTHLDCVVTCFTGTLVIAFIGWAVFGNGQVEWKVFRNFRLNIVSLDFSPRGYLLLTYRPSLSS